MHIFCVRATLCSHYPAHLCLFTSVIQLYTADFFTHHFLPSHSLLLYIDTFHTPYHCIWFSAVVNLVFQTVSIREDAQVMVRQQNGHIAEPQNNCVKSERCESVAISCDVPKKALRWQDTMKNHPNINSGVCLLSCEVCKTNLKQGRSLMVVSVSFHVASVKSLSSISITWSCMNGLIVESGLFLVMCVTNLLSLSVTWSNIYAFMVVNVPTYVKCVKNLSSGRVHWKCICSLIKGSVHSHVMCVRNLSGTWITWRNMSAFTAVNAHFRVNCVINLSSGSLYWKCIYAHIVENILPHMMCLRNLLRQRNPVKMHLNTGSAVHTFLVTCVRNISGGRRTWKTSFKQCYV